MRKGRENRAAAVADYYFDDPESEVLSKPRAVHKLLGGITIFIAAAFFLNTTLAANVSLTSSGNREFGQGILQTTACSGNASLKIQPASSFSNVSAGGSYVLASIKVTNIPDSCFGSDFVLNAYGETSTTPLTLFNSTSTDAVIYNNSGTFQPGAGSTGMTIASGSGEFTATFTVPVAMSASVSRVTIQSKPRAIVSCALGGPCVVGDVGPGGGKVFYVSVGGFSCGPTRTTTCNYLELAPANWSGGADPARSWAQSTPVDYTSTTLILNQALGYGALNTKAIIDQGNSNTSTSAAAMAASYSPVLNGVAVSDWFLPSENEFAEVWTQRTVIGLSMSGNNYWNSSSVAQTNGRFFIFGGGSMGAASGAPKATTYLVRPARAF